MLEERLEQERQLAEAKIEKAHTTMLEIVKNRANPLEHVSTLLSTFHEVQELLGGGAPAASGDDGVPKRPKSVGELVVDKLVAAADRLFPSVEPVLQHAVRTYLDRTVREGAQTVPVPAAGLTGQLPAPQPAALPAPAEPPPAAVRELDWGKAISTVVADLDDGMNRNLPPRSVWENLQAAMPPVAEMLKAYGSVDQLASELETLAAAPAFAVHANAIRSVARKAAGPSRRWTEQFLDVVRGNGKAPAAPSTNGGNA